MRTFARIPIGGQILLVERRRDVHSVSMARLRLVTESKRGGGEGPVAWLSPSILPDVLTALRLIAAGDVASGYAARIPADGREVVVEFLENPVGYRQVRLHDGRPDAKPLWVTVGEPLEALVSALQAVAASFGQEGVHEEN